VSRALSRTSSRVKPRTRRPAPVQLADGVGAIVRNVIAEANGDPRAAAALVRKRVCWRQQRRVLAALTRALHA